MNGDSMLYVSHIAHKFVFDVIVIKLSETDFYSL